MSSKSVMTMSEPFTVTGSGFRPSESIAVQLIGESASPIVGETTANSSGAFSASFDSVTDIASVIAGGDGDSTLLAKGADGSLASTPVEIVSSPRSTSPSSSLRTPPVEPAADATIIGSGFLADEFVTLVVVGAGVNGTDITLSGGGGRANSSGAFSLIATINLDEGIYTLRATGSNGSEATTALVVAEK